MLSKELLDILVCPYCRTALSLHGDGWLMCQNPECARKYPIVDDIPVMLVEEGTKWKDTDPSQLPDPSSLRL